MTRKERHVDPRLLSAVHGAALFVHLTVPAGGEERRLRRTEKRNEMSDKEREEVSGKKTEEIRDTNLVPRRGPLRPSTRFVG